MKNILKDKIFENPDNQTVLNFFKLKAATASLRSWDSSKIAFEGEIIFFEKYAENLPQDSKYQLGIYSILINENSGQIFALHFGRFTFIFRCDFERNKIKNREELQTGETLDDFIDIRQLGENWIMLDKFIDEEKEQIEWSYEFTKKQRHLKEESRVK